MVISHKSLAVLKVWSIFVAAIFFACVKFKIQLINVVKRCRIRVLIDGINLVCRKLEQIFINRC
ncbi:Uncharacterised protein [Escherichia coli]|uniref:Uncharacterized protein n=1 Tax=Escherichia coli TaxID=562 RepID=A0A377CCP1_ECOLX|nr:Uncharacterised protein [Escherichia coli]